MERAETRAVRSKTANDTYLNWLSFRKNKPRSGIVEARLYTDVWITGEVSGLGPYSFINTVATSDSKELRPAVVLRMAQHLTTERPSLPMNNDFDHYHGGDFIDEMAALASLVLGIRMQAGPIDRDFMPGGDPLGRPTQYGSKAVPVLPRPYQSPQIPRLQEPRNLDDLKMLEDFSKRTVNETNALIKAARMYQQAVWVCDADPALAWILLISAVETVAVLWAGDSNNPTDSLRASLPKLFDLLDVDTYRGLIDPVAQILSEITRSTKKFIDFLAEFVPEPPPVRPPEAFRFLFRKAKLKKAASLIYGHRSASLHSGTAFPLPMCIPPKRWKFDGVPDAGYGEIPTGLATSSRGATWKLDQTPMLLHTFEHIARGAILNWWHGSQT
jgi:hypothetical protein